MYNLAAVRTVAAAGAAGLELTLLNLLDRLARRVLHHLDPEDGHSIALRALPLAPAWNIAPDDSRLAVNAFGLRFPNPVGLAAGLDKNGEVVEAVLRLGFGFTEVGTVTPQPQAGNPRPRMVRLPADEGVINRLGFNNQGHTAVRERLAGRTARGVLGINIGANKDSTDRVADYVAGIRAFAPLASYFTVNVSSPNTPGLRDLQQAQALDDLLARVLAARDERAAAERRPVLLKIAPDLSLADLDDIVGTARRRGIDGMIVSNTTVTRPGTLQDTTMAGQAGGLSGRPLFALSTRMLAETFVRVDGAFPLVGVGGIDSGEAAWAKIAAGATLIQLYTAMVYRGIGLIREIKQHLTKQIERDGLSSITAAAGRDAQTLITEPWPN